MPGMPAVLSSPCSPLPQAQNPSHIVCIMYCFFRRNGHRNLLDQNPSFVPGRDAWECPSHSPLVDCGVLRYTWRRAVTTGPNTRVEVSVLGRLDMFLTTREPQSCFAGAPTSVWHRSRPSQCLSQRFPETRRQSDSRKPPGLRHMHRFALDAHSMQAYFCP